MNYINLETKEIFTRAMLSHVKSDAEIKALGLLPVEYAYPVIDNALFTFKPKKDLTRLENGFVQEFDVVERPLEEAQKSVKERVTAKRWEVETGGIMLNGVEILSGIDDQNRIATSLSGMEAAEIESVNFKAASGWTRLTQADLKAIKVALALHVEACFDRERELHELVDACASIAELEALDINAGWPAKEKTAAA